MPKRLAAAAAAAVFAAGSAAASPPDVAADIAPVHSLTARVMAGVGEPALIVREGASPHGYSLRPSEAAALQETEIVFWVSSQLTPWLDGALDNLAPDARTIELIEAAGTERLEFRKGATFERHRHEENDHDAHDHGGRHADEGGDEAHDHEGVDPHAWLDPANARAWVDVIANALAEADPANAAAYRANAKAARAEVSALSEEVTTVIAPVRDKPYVVFHDAYQYFERRFEIPAAGAISLSDASDPSPARVAEIRDLVSELDAACVFAEPQFDAGIVRAVFETGEVRTAVLDPLGVALEPGPGLYAGLMRKLARDLADCLR